jgi:hypothetical protein
MKMSEREYIVGAAGGAGAAGGTNQTSSCGIIVDSAGLSEEAQRALKETDALHGQIDDLEARLFGPSPRGVSDDAPKAQPSLANTLKGSRQRLESASNRLSTILSRL